MTLEIEKISKNVDDDNNQLSDSDLLKEVRRIKKLNKNYFIDLMLMSKNDLIDKYNDEYLLLFDMLYLHSELPRIKKLLGLPKDEQETLLKEKSIQEKIIIITNKN